MKKRYELECTFLDYPLKGKERKPVKPGQNPEAAASRLRGYYHSPAGRKWGRVVVTLIEITEKEVKYAVGDDCGRVIKTNLTLAEAQAMCEDSEYSYWPVQS